VMEGMNMN